MVNFRGRKGYVNAATGLVHYVEGAPTTSSMSSPTIGSGPSWTSFDGFERDVRALRAIESLRTIADGESLEDIGLFDLFSRKDKRIEDSIRSRVPPGQVLTEKWPVLHYGPVPRVDLKNWRFRVTGLVENPTEWSWDDFITLPRCESVSDIHCVTRWSRLDNHWAGVSARDVLSRFVVKPEAKFIVVHSENNFTANLPLEALLDDNVLFAYEHDGKPLSPDHGWPLRLVVPNRYFWKSAKWVRGLEFMSQDRLGFWEELGYHNDADPWHEQRYWGD